ncbi:MAG: ribonuclease PH, partial [Synergistaceae bacterium]|nr:ribonuclease PH [Synergistaceae bacterium]
SSAEVDMNFVMNHRGEYIEIQGTGEGGVFSAGDLSELLVLGGKGTQEVIEKQKEALSLDESELSFS